MTSDMSVRRMAGFEGEIVRPGDAEYDRRRAVWNAMHDRRPALIARCTSARDVVIAVEHGRRKGFRSRCEPAATACRATVQGGALLGELDRATQRHGLVVPAGVVSHTGVAGLTLGGGVGRLMRRFGLTIDSLLAAQVVTADGRILEASEDQNADLFWGIRGGGGNFGVVTKFEFALHELSELLILATFHPLERVPAVLALGREAMAAGDASDELLWTSFLRKAPPLPWLAPDLVGRPGIMSLIEWSGEPEPGRHCLEALHAELSPLAGSLETVPFLQMQTLTDEIFAAGKRTYIKAGFATELTDALIKVLCQCGGQVGSEFSQIEVLAQGGAIGRVAPEATAFPHRDAAWLVNIPATWEDPAADGEEIGWARRSFTAIEPHLTGGKYVNFMGDDEREDAGGAYGATLRRLRSVKRVYDPDNVFRLNQNIEP
ncbi:MAG: FAD-binding oxidoreductase [Solirubrobacteraceae bacterium]